MASRPRGGRFPTPHEIRTGIENEALTDECDDDEWTDNGSGSDTFIALDGGSASCEAPFETTVLGRDASVAFRCFVGWRSLD